MLLLLVLLLGCGPKRLPPYEAQTPEEQQRLTAQAAELDARMEGLSRSREEWFAESTEFSKRAAGLARQAALLRNYPGWSDLERIITAEPSIRQFEGGEVAAKKTNEALAAWGKKWNAPGSVIYSNYLILADQGRNLENDRLALLRRWEELSREWAHTQQEMNLNALVRAGLGDPTRDLSFLYRMIESQQKRDQELDSQVRSFLNSFEIDSLQLYYGPTREANEKLQHPSK